MTFLSFSLTRDPTLRLSALLVAPPSPLPDPPGKRDTFACGVPAAGARDVQRRHEAVRSALREVRAGGAPP